MKHKPDLLLHICCAPCSTHAIAVLSDLYQIRPFFFNPNIYPPEEYYYRLQETQHYVKSLGLDLLSPQYSRKEWLALVRSDAVEPEGGRRCRKCFAFRLRKTAETAANLGIGFYTTTLTIGPNKPAAVIFPIAEKISSETGVVFVARDFKKQNGFKKSCELSVSLGMYRQNYCGCEYSLRDKNRRIMLRKQEDPQTQSTEPHTGRKVCLPNKPPTTGL
jgi:epoxyqueuosine reductase